MARRITPVNYSARDFESIKSELVQYAKRYYPETFRDFNQASFGALMLDMVSYVGDTLSFYLDYQANESFFDTATERNNIIRQAKQMGYQYRGASTATGMCNFYIVVPANSTGLGPNSAYLPILKQRTSLSSTGGGGFLLAENVNFGDTTNPVTAARVNPDTGVPTHYAVKARGKVVSGRIILETHRVGGFQRFRKIQLKSRKVSEVLSVFDDQGHEYTQVDYLSQDVVYKEMGNRGSTANDQVTSIIKPIIVPRRFVIEQTGTRSFLQFGYGSDSEITSDSVAEPSQIVLNQVGRSYIEDVNFDPSKLLDTDKFGVAPANTILTITYRVNSGTNSNAAARTLTRIQNPLVEWKDRTAVTAKVVRDVIGSIECTNDEPIVGSVADPSTRELKRRAIDHFATQNRAVTERDYEAMVYAMPPQFGAIKRCKIVRDDDSFKRNLNLYVLAENRNGTLAEATMPLKENLKTWIGNMKMVHDTIDVIDGRFINFGLKYSIIADPDFNKYTLLDDCNRALADYYAEPLYFGESLYITDIYSILSKLDGVVATENVEFIQKEGGTYSTTTYSFKSNMSSDGRQLLVPDNVCMELKFPSSDISGAIK